MYCNVPHEKKKQKKPTESRVARNPSPPNLVLAKKIKSI
jgi:hypothetical protein